MDQTQSSLESTMRSITAENTDQLEATAEQLLDFLEIHFDDHGRTVAPSVKIEQIRALAAEAKKYASRAIDLAAAEAKLRVRAAVSHSSLATTAASLAILANRTPVHSALGIVLSGTLTIATVMLGSRTYVDLRRKVTFDDARRNVEVAYEDFHKICRAMTLILWRRDDLSEEEMEEEWRSLDLGQVQAIPGTMVEVMSNMRGRSIFRVAD